MRRDEVWPKFIATSQHMEKVLKQFDDEYPWNGNGRINVGQPDIPNRPSQPKAGLRDLYCYFIESILTNIEKRADTWLTTATSNYKADFEATKDGKKWLDTVLRTGGLISATTLKFPGSAFKHNPANPSQPTTWTQSNFKGLWITGNGAAGPF